MNFRGYGCAAAIGLCLVALASPTTADFFTYSRWAALPPAERYKYIEGAFDSLIAFSVIPGDASFAQFYAGCLDRAQMSGSQLAENIRTFASTRPQLQGGGTAVPMMQYLVALCGSPK